METDLLNYFFETVVDFYHSDFFYFFKFLVGIYVAVLLVDIVLLLFVRNPVSDIRVTLKGVQMPAVSKDTMKKKWTKIKERLESENISQYKVAILEADLLVDQSLSDIGIAGGNLTERLKKIGPGQIANYEEIKNAHILRNRIVHEADFAIDKKTASEIISVYEKALKSLELF